MTEELSAAEVLRRVRGKLEKPKSWTKGVAARTAFGGMVDPNHPRAVRWCILGAIVSVAPPKDAPIEAFRIVVGSSIPDWNDAPERTHAEVLAALDKAIAIAEGIAS